MNHPNFHLLFRNNLFIPLIVTSFLFACKKEEVKPVYSNGTIEGRVNIQEDTYGSVLVTASGPYGDKTVKVEKSPETSIYSYSFTGLGNGTYKISATRDSFGTVDYHSIPVFGADSVMVPLINLYRIPIDPAIPVLPVYETQDNSSIVFGNAATNEKYRLIAFMSSKNDVSYTKYQSFANIGVENNKIRIYKDKFFIPDTKVYFVIYACDYNDPGYMNFYYNKKIFSSINPKKHSQVFSAIIK